MMIIGRSINMLDKNILLTKKPKAVVIGTSAGGFQLLLRIFSNLNTHFSLPIFLVQHLSKNTDKNYIDTLSKSSKIPVCEVLDKVSITPGKIFVAPPDYHLLVETTQQLSIGLFEQVSYSRPSVDVLFESAAEVYQDNLLGIILSGANSDGAKGLKKIIDYGGIGIAQDLQEAEFKRMPESALKMAKGSYMFKLEKIIETLNHI